MQDSGRRDPKGRFSKGGVANPYGRAGKPVARLDSLPTFDSLPGEHIEPTRISEMIRMDGWQNPTTGVGVPGFDKSINTKFVTEIFTRQQVVEMWRGDPIAARVIECMPKEATQKGYELNIADEGDYGDLKDQVEQMVDDLELNDKLLQSLKMERGFGGSALLIGANDGQDMSMPLNMDGIIELMYVTPLEPDELSPLTSYADPMHPKFGQTELWQISAMAQSAVGYGDPLQRTLPRSSVIHESRLIIFPGLRVSKTQTRTGVMGAHWGDSVLNRVALAIATFHMGFANTSIILSEHGLPIFHMKELAKLINANRRDIVQARLSMLFQQMSTARAAVIDLEENYERKAMPLNGLSDILDRLCVYVASAVEMPVTKLMGQSPKGLGNEGESDMEQWYDNVASYQDGKIRRPLRRLLQIVMRALHVQEPLKWSIKFNPLKQLSDKELAEARLIQMQIDTGYAGAGMLTADEVRDSRWSGEYSHETQLDPDAWAAMNVTNQPLTPEDMMAMGLDPNDPNAAAQAQEMMAQGQMPPGMDPNAPPEIDPETGEPIAPEGEIDPETGEPIEPPPGEEPEIDPETGEPVAPAPGEETEGAQAGPVPFGKKPAAPGAPVPFGKPAAPGAKPAMPGAKPPAPFGKKPAKPGEEPVEGADGEPVPEVEGAKPALGKNPAKPVKPGEEPPPDGEEQPVEGEEGQEGQETPEDSTFANSEQGSGQDPAKPGQAPAKPGMAPEKQGPTARSGETDEDRQRMSAQRPGQPLHVIDRDKNGKISAAEAQAAGLSLDDVMAQIEALHQELNGGAKLPAQPVSPDENGEVELPPEGEPAPEGEEGELAEEPEEGEEETPVKPGAKPKKSPFPKKVK